MYYGFSVVTAELAGSTSYAIVAWNITQSIWSSWKQTHSNIEAMHEAPQNQLYAVNFELFSYVYV